MAKNRTIPFGYMMRNGRITANPKEVLAVVTIFSEYLAGKSLSEIAAEMDVPYSENSKWNKNMVKRIIENEKYLGTTIFPQLISEEIFRPANEKRVKKATFIHGISEELNELRKITVCNECGHRMFSSGGNTRSEKWDCHNSECSRFEYRLTDSMLIGGISAILDAVSANPELIDTDCEISGYTSNGEIILKQNKINQMIDAIESDLDEVKNEIFRLAEMKYQRCTYSDIPQKTGLLKTLFSEEMQLENLDIDFLKSAVKQIKVSHNFTIETEFINGIKIRNTTERGDENGSFTECNDNSCKP